MSKRRTLTPLQMGLAAAGVAIAIGAGVWFLAVRDGDVSERPSPEEERAESPLDPIPADAEMVIWMDLEALSREDAWQSLQEDDSSVFARITETCGSELVDALEEVTLFSLPATEEFSAVVRGSVAPGELADCLAKLQGAEPSHLRMEDLDGTSAVVATESAVAAEVGDVVAVGSRSSVRAVIEVTEGASNSAASVELLSSLWRRAAPDAHIVAVGRILENWKPMLRAARQNTGVRSFSTLVNARGFALGMSLADPLTVRATLEMGTPSAARDGLPLIRDDIASAGGRPELAASPVAALLEHVQAELDGSHLRLTVTASGDDRSRILEALGSVSAGPGATPPQVPQGSAPAGP